MVIDAADGLDPIFAVVGAVIIQFEGWPIEDQRRIGKAKSPLSKIGRAFGLIPFEQRPL